MKNKTLKRISILLFVCSLSSITFAQIIDKPDFTKQASFILSDATIAYEEKNFLASFNLAQEAVRIRKNESDWASSILNKALLSPSAQKIGKDISTLLKYFYEREEYDVVSVVEYTLVDLGVEYFDYNIDNLVAHIALASNFPEADYLLGNLYMTEGELSIAEKYLLKAYEYKNLLDVPQIQYDILYALSDLYLLQKDMNAYEEVLLLIVSENEQYKKVDAFSSFLHTTKSAIKNGMDVDTFFLYFRDNYYIGLSAWYGLTKYYLDLAEIDKAFETAIMLCLVSLTRINEVLENRNMHYTYTNLSDFFSMIKKYDDVATWALEYVWEGFYRLAELSNQKGYDDFKNGLYEALSTECPVRQWQVLSKSALEN